MKIHKITNSLLAIFLLIFAAGTANAVQFKLANNNLCAAGEKDTLVLQLEGNSFEFTSFQLDVELPTGILIDGKPFLASDMADGHTISWEIQQGNQYRGVVYSLSNHNFKQVNGTLLMIPVQLTAGFASGEFKITNGLLANKKSESYTIDPYASTLTALIEKQSLVVNVSGLEQKVDENKAAEISYSVVPEGIALDVQYYTDAELKNVADENERKQEGVFYVKISFAGDNTYAPFEETYVMSVTNKTEIAIATLPEATAIVKGQLLSLSLLSGGSAQDGDNTVPGNFVWTNGNTEITSSGKYAVTFIPSNTSYYNTKDTVVDVEVIPTFLITTIAENGGSILMAGKNSDNLYVKDQSITLTAIPATNYQFAGWKLNGNSITGGEQLTFNAKEDGTYSASFEPIMHKISWEVTGDGNIQVSTENGNISNNSELRQGTNVQISVTPNSGSQLSSLKINGSDFTAGSLKMQEAVNIQVTFEQKPVDMYSIQIEKSEHGSLLIYKEDGTPVLSGSTVPVNTNIMAVTLPAAGYQVNEIQLNGSIYNSGSTYTVTQDITAKASFGVKKYKVTAQALSSQVGQTASGSIELNHSGEVDYGEIVRITNIQAQEGAILLYILANGKEINQQEELVVTGDLTVTAVFDHRVDIQKEYIMWPHQSFYYNGVSRNFVPFASQTYAGFSFDVTYKRVKNGSGTNVTENAISKAIDAGEYTVILDREEDGLYNKFHAEYEAGLTIHQSKVLVTQAPENENSNPSTRPSEVNITSTKEGNMTKYEIKPSGESNINNYLPTTYYYSNAPKVAIQFGNTGLLRSAEEVKGYVRITNGGLAYEGKGQVEIPKGTIVELEAIPASGYKFNKWKDGNAQNPREYTIGEAIDLTPEFITKPTINISGLESNSSTYDGTAKTVKVKGSDDLCQVLFFSDEACTQPAEMKNAGTYYVRVYRPEDESYLEFRQVYSYTINPATPSINWPEASSVLAGQKLSTSELLGGDAGLVAGSFTWSKPDQVLDKTTSCEVKFIPLDLNYKETTGNISVEVVSGEKGEPTTPTEDKKVIEDGNNETISGTVESIEAKGEGTNELSNVTATTLTVSEGGERTFTLSGTINIDNLINKGTLTLKGDPTVIQNLNITNYGVFSDETGTITEVKGYITLKVTPMDDKTIDEGETVTLTAKAEASEEVFFTWQKYVDNTWESVEPSPEMGTRALLRNSSIQTSQLVVSSEKAGQYRCIIFCKSGTVSATLITYVSVRVNTETEDPNTPGESNKYYTISTDKICDGIEISFSTKIVKGGQSVSVYVKKDETNYTFDNLKLYCKRTNYGAWEELQESTKPGEYKIDNIWTHIYVKAEGSEKKNPTGMEEVEDVKVYTKDGSLFVQTSQREQVIVISMTGAVVKNEEQIGLKQYHGLNPGIYIVRIGNNIYKIRIK